MVMLGNCDGKDSARSMPVAGNSFDKDANEGGSGLSSEFEIWIAALTLPSSSFAATACDSRAESDAEWRPEWAVLVCLSDI